MRIDQILAHWEQDSNIDITKLDTESIKISKLHKKYHEIFTTERCKLRVLESDLAKLRLSKFEFYTQGPTKETHDMGWKLPPIGKVLKTDANQYIDADDDIIKLKLDIGIQHEKITLLESIIKMLMNRQYALRTALDTIKFQAGF